MHTVPPQASSHIRGGAAPHCSLAVSTINHLRRAVLFPSRSIRRMRALCGLSVVATGGSATDSRRQRVTPGVMRPPGRSLTSLVSSLVNQGESGFAAAPDIRCEDSVTDDEVMPTGT